MNQSLLSHIAGSFISQYENVANSSISYLLNTYPAARVTLGKILNINEIPIRYVTELGAGKNGRPDVTGINERGDKLIIIEGKFWANLTSNQPLNYIKELSENGKILFLAPVKRQDSLNLELENRLIDSNTPNLVKVMSWAKFIDAIENENAKNPDFSLTSDLTQLKALCNRMDVEGMPPLSASDLDPMNGRIAYQLADLLDECRELLSQWPETDFKGLRAAGWKLGYGFYFRARGFGCMLSFSSLLWFTTKSATPYWLNIGDQNFKRSEIILNALAHWDPENTYADQPNAAYAIRLHPGMDRRATVEYIVKSVKEAINVASTNGSNHDPKV